MLVFLLALPFFLYMALLSSGLQTRIVRFATTQLEAITHTDISIGKIYFKPFKTIKINDLYVSDDNRDTLFYIHKLSASINWLNLSDSYIWLGHVHLDSAKVYFTNDSTETMNLLRFIDSFGTDTTNTPSEGPPFTLKVSDLQIRRTNFRLKSYQPEYVESGMNYEDIFFKNMYLDAENFKLVNAYIFMDINHLSAREQSGVKIDTIQGYFAMDSTGIGLENMHLRLDSTFVRGKKQKLVFSGFAQMSDFLSEIVLDSDIESARIRTDELAWFVPEFKNWNLDIKLNGKISGTVNKLQGTHLNISLTDSTYISTSLAINGLPDTEHTYVHAIIHDLNAYTTDISNIELIAGDSGENIFPDFLQHLSFKGKATGFFNNITLDGTLKTDVGALYAKLNYADLNNKSEIKGFVQATNIRVDKITGDAQTFGRASLKTNINGKFDPSGQFNAIIKTNINYFDINQYRLNNIAINGTLTENDFDGNVQIADSALDMNFTGIFEFGTDQLNQKFLLNLHHANLFKLNLDPNPKSTISADIMATISGLSPNEISGNINVLDLQFNRANDSIRINELTIQSRPTGYHHDIKINSDFFDIELAGNFLIENLSPALSQLVAQYSPQTAWDTTFIEAEHTAFNLKVDMLNIQPLIKLFTTQIAISNNTVLNSTFNKEQNILLIETTSDQIEIAGMKMNGASIRAFNLPHSIQANISSNRFNYAGNYALTDLKISSIIQPDSVDLNINWDNSIKSDTSIYSGNINLSVGINANDSIILDKYAINMDPSYIVIADTLWQLNRSQIIVDTTSYEFRNFKIENGYQSLELDGKISALPSDTMRILANNINISHFNLFTKSMGLDLKGVLNAKMKVAQVYNNPFIGSNISLNKLTINDQLIGNTDILTEWDPFLEMIHLEWLSTIADTEVLNIIGDYDPANARMNFRIFIDRFNLSILEPYMAGVIHDIQGLTTTEIILKGTLENPELQGVVIFDRTAFTVDYTQTRYEITDWFDIAPDAIYFNALRITDKYNNYGYLDGKITHDNFNDIAIDMNFNSRNLMFLNTRQSDNEVFYGSLFATGKTKISGSTDNLDLNISMRTDENTKLFIPLENSGEVSEYEFIKFKQKDTVFTLNINKLAEQETPSTIGINMNLNITPDAELQIIFDSKIGDIIKSRGSADLNIVMNKSGDLNIYGDYIIEKGDYLFTLQDIFQKHLTIAKGSNISWAGDPLDAIVDIDAIYRVRRASIYDLTYNIDHQEIVVPVETHLLMTGGLESPEIGFNLDLPSTVEDVQEQINALPKEEINKQVLSLLVMNRFLPLPGAQTVAKNDDFGMESNASELLSNQVSNWLSQISSSVDIGFNYTPGDEVESQEYEVAVSTQLLNNRVTVQTNIGMGGQQVSATDETDNTSSIAGDFQVDVKLNKTGKIRLKAYAKSNEDIYTDAETTQGLGIFYKEEFNTFRELWEKLFGSKDKKQE